MDLVGQVVAAAQRGWAVIEIRLDVAPPAELAGRTAVVTGATSGIGRASALALVARGARVVGVGRDLTRGARLEHAAARLPGTGSLVFRPCEFAELDQVVAFAAALRAECPRLDVLVHCAGGHYAGRQCTAAGIEANLAVNHLSKFLLTEQLTETLLDGAGLVMVVGSLRAGGSPAAGPDQQR